MLVGGEIPALHDGLGDVARAVLHGMHKRGLVAHGPLMRTRDVVDMLGLPHADEDVYAVIVGLVHDARTRYPLLEGEGNFGSIDGDPPAEPEYTECGLSAAGMAAVDGSFPVLLANGAFGWDTLIPPHNFGELAAAAATLLDAPDAPLERLMEHVPGPDFPTGAIVSSPEALPAIYATGRGTLTHDARIHHGDLSLIVTEIPYGAAKGGENGAIDEVADMINSRQLDDVTDINDLSDRRGMRLIFDVRSPAVAAEVRETMLVRTQLRSDIYVDMTVLDGGTRRTVPFRDLLCAHVAARRAALGSNELLRSELRDLAVRFASPRRTTIGP